MPYDEAAELEDAAKMRAKRIKRKYKRDIDMVYYITRLLMSNPKDEEAILDALKLNMNQLKMIVTAKHEISRVNFQGMLLHWIFLALFFSVIYFQQRTNFAFVMNQAITNTIVTDDFNNIGSWGDLSNYLKNDFVPIFTQTSYYNGDSYTSTQSLYVAENNRVIGSVRFRQLRVKDGSCSISQQAKSISDFCYANDYSSSTKDTQPFGPSSDPTRYQYISASKSGSETVDSLEGGGYVVDVPLWPVNNLSNVTDSLIADRWFDLPTRAVIITVNFFNVGLDNRVAVLYLIVQVNAGGLLSSTYIVDSFKINYYSSTTDYIRLVLEILFIAMFALLVFRKLREVKQHYRRGGIREYLTENWQFVDISFFVLQVIIIFMYAALLIEFALNSADLGSTSYVPSFERLASITSAYFNIVSLALLFGVVRTFKFWLSNSRLTLMWSVLQSVSTDLYGLLISSFFLMLGFMLFGLIAFGSNIESFNGFSQCFETVAEFVIGNPPDWDTMAQVNPILGPLFIVLFTVFIFVALMNMFIAILNKGYTYVSSRPGDTLFKSVGNSVRTLPGAHYILDVFDDYIKKFDQEEDDDDAPLKPDGFFPASPEKDPDNDGKDGADNSNSNSNEKIDIIELDGTGVRSPSSDSSKDSKSKSKTQTQTQVEQKIDLLFNEITEIHKLLNQMLNDKQSG